MCWTRLLAGLVIGAMAGAAGAQVSSPYAGGPTTGIVTVAGPVVFTPGRLEKGAFLGITTSPVSPAMRQQLKLPKGMGLAVDFVEKDSPAEAAGLKQYDVLQKLNDQLLVNPQQFAVLIRSFKAGDEITLTVIREAAPQQIKAKLAEKELLSLDDMMIGGMGVAGPGIPGMPELPNIRPIPLEDPQIREWMNQHFQPGGGMILNGQGRSVMSWSDGNQKLTVTTDNGKDKHLTVTDKTGNTVFDGPIQTDEQRKVLPGDIAEKLKQMEKQMTVEVGTGGAQTQIRVGPRVAPPATNRSHDED